ncbi:hypothetical protein LUZ60_017760 [Juncus effusus]|nr:hypothetical protein LUZ60_017760 [Juncus effusus]
MKVFIALICILLCAFNAAGGRQEPEKGSSNTTFNVLQFGARADGKTDDSKAFMAAWKAVCGSSGDVKLHVPTGTYFISPVKFLGPCKNANSITIYLKGTLKASTDLSKYVEGDDWVEFRQVKGLTLDGGTFDGQGAASWRYNLCPKNKNCKVLPTSVKLVSMTDTVLRGITSLNPKFFHMAIVGCTNLKASDIKISAPANSPNTDGIHIERSSGVSIHSATVGTGDDCISIGQGNSAIVLSGIRCGPGHGISVGSLGRYQNEGDVKGLLVKDCIISGTENGVRIKTWQNSPGISAATNMTFENIQMKNVKNPINIDQMYCPYAFCSSQVPSKVKISDIFFRDISGTSSTPVAVSLKCSKGIPCQNINLHNVQLKYIGGKPATSLCANVMAMFTGTHDPPPC